MRIAQIAPLAESVPPQLYGGTERVVSYLTEALVEKGHEVTLFASGDSKTAAKLIPCTEKALRLDERCIDHLAHSVLMLEKVFSMVHEFDVMHFHIDYLHFPLSARYGETNVTTLHGRLDIPELPAIYQRFSAMPVVSISQSQRIPLAGASWAGTVHHGLPVDSYRPSFDPGGPLVFLGRISPEKRADRAVEIAQAVGMKIIIGAKVDRADREYYKNEIQPVFANPLVDYIGEVNEVQKQALLRSALALLFPIDWEEPFGLVMIEAMACGTPVIAWNRGSVPEIIEDGINGFLVNSIEEAVEAVHKIKTGFDRKRCYDAFRARFTAERMATDYEAIYQNLLTRTLRTHSRAQTGGDNGSSFSIRRKTSSGRAN